MSAWFHTSLCNAVPATRVEIGIAARSSADSRQFSSLCRHSFLGKIVLPAQRPAFGLPNGTSSFNLERPREMPQLTHSLY